MHKALSIACSIVCGLALGACQASPDRSTTTVEGLRSDSAGITIVEHVLPAGGQSSAPAWHLGAATFRIDSIPRASRPELHKISGAAFLDAGDVLVGHEGGKELLLFAADGHFVRSIGRGGSGPGEFRAMAGPWSLDRQRFAVVDGVTRRTTVFAPAPAGPDSIERITAFTNRTLPDSSYFVWRSFGVTRTGATILWVMGPPIMAVGMTRPNMSIVAVDSTGTAVRVGPDRPGLEQYVMAAQKEGSFSLGMSPFAASPLATACGDRVAVADNQSYTVSMMTLDSRVVSIIRASVPPRPVSDADYRAVARTYVEQESDITEDMLAPMRLMTPRGLLPVLSALHCDATGRLWVEEHPDQTRGERRVTGYTTDGARRFVLMLPVTMRILGVQDTTVAVSVTDADGVEHFELRPVERIRQ